MTASVKDKIIPVIFNLVNLSLKIITESKVSSTPCWLLLILNLRKKEIITGNTDQSKTNNC